MKLPPRSSGVLLHTSSLPGPHGIGDLGVDAHRFVDWLADAGQSLWQMLPINPIGPGHSPYQSVSAFAGSPLMVALAPLVHSGWLAEPVLPEPPFDPMRVDYERVQLWRLQQLRSAAQGFFASAADADRALFQAWCTAQCGWLDDFALFMALEVAHRGEPWWAWPAPLRWRESGALRAAWKQHEAEAHVWQFIQWCFDTQFAQLKAHANARGVALVGDLPIFIAHHSVDCWSRPDLYELDADGLCPVVAGAPPDDLGPEGQRWGNPLYRWNRMAEENFAWWTARVQRALAHADVFRIDHFRGFAGYWAIPAESFSARDGHWREGPGKALFDAIEAALGKLPIIAEDLGLITPDVVALREACGYPGMKILQFAFGGDATHPFLPHNIAADFVVYTGTHDNDTALGWWDHAPLHERDYAAIYLECDDHGLHAALMRAASQSAACMAIFPMQDVLGRSGDERMNVPGTLGGDNWVWRFAWNDAVQTAGRLLAQIGAASGRSPFRLLKAVEHV